jgi:DNA-binding beta-propeller fold protein YncE
MKRLRFFLIVMLMVGLVGMVSADKPKKKGIGVFANLNTNCIQYIDPDTNTASDPLLKGYLGTYAGGLLDVVITANGKTAIVSNFGDSMIHFIDISEGFDEPPTLLGSVWISLFAEDLAITPDDKYVLITDGGLASQVAVVDIPNRSLVYVQDLRGRDAQAIAITPDPVTPEKSIVLMADYLNGEIHSYSLDTNGYLSFRETQIVLPAWPVNIAISPDGKTVIVASAFLSIAPVFSIDSVGDLVFREFISLPALGGQSCIFDKKGEKAYFLTNGNPGKGTQVHILNVTGPGHVSASGTSITVYPPYGTGQFFGVDTIALDPDEEFLYVSNPTSFGALNGISVIDLTIPAHVFSIKGTGYPTGICFSAKTKGNGDDGE